MAIDILELESFYRTPLGALCVRQISAALNRLPSPIDAVDFALGYGTPFLGQTGTLLMPAQQGTVQSAQPTVLVDEFNLPLRDRSLSTLLAIHFLEHSRDGEQALREVWRVLRPEGRLILVVPNRRGVWSGGDRTPFGAGHPYSRGQLRRIAQMTGFVSVMMTTALHFPPSQRLIPMVSMIEPVWRLLLSEFSGLLLVELIKRVPAPIKVRQSQPRFTPALAHPALRRNASSLSLPRALKRKDAGMRPPIIQCRNSARS